MSIFDTTVMNTSAPVSAIWDDTVPKEPEYFDYGHRDPLAMLLSWMNQDEDPAAGVNTVKYGEKLIKAIACDYSDEEYQLAGEIRHYYQEKLIMKSLRGEDLTRYQKSLADVLAEPNKLCQDAVGVLVRLPMFYQEDCAMDSLLRDMVSAEQSRNGEYDPNTQWRLINNSAITSYNRKRRHKRYFLKNEKNQLVMLYSKPTDPEGNTAILDALVENFDCFAVSGPMTLYPLPGRYFSVGVVTHRNKLKVVQ